MAEDPKVGIDHALTVTNGRLVPNLTRMNPSDKINHRWYKVLALHLAGESNAQIAEECGYEVSTVSVILNNKDMIALRQQLLSDSWKEFEALQAQVIGVIKNKLKSQDEGVQLAAVQIWMKAAQKYAQKLTGINVTAEDVVLQIMNGDVTQVKKDE